MNCKYCDGTERCAECDGEGGEDCGECGAYMECEYCDGTGICLECEEEE